MSASPRREGLPPPHQPFGTRLSVVISLKCALSHVHGRGLVLERATENEVTMRLLLVVRQGSGWTIMASGKPWGRFNYRVDAEEAALRLAATAAPAGVASEVRVVQPCGSVTPLKVA